MSLATFKALLAKLVDHALRSPHLKTGAFIFSTIDQQGKSPAVYARFSRSSLEVVLAT